MTMRRATILLFALALSAATATAQQPQSPQTDDTPTLTNDDVAPSRSATVLSREGSAAADRYLQSFYDELSRKGATADEISKLRSHIDSGGEVAVAIRFDVDSNGHIVNLAEDGSSGFAAIDRMVPGEMRNAGTIEPLAGFSAVRIEVAFSKVKLRVHAMGTAPTEEQAVQLESLGRTLKEAQRSGQSNPFADAVLARNGPTLTLSFEIPFASLTGAQ
jgi:hypothetical protein